MFTLKSTDLICQKVTKSLGLFPLLISSTLIPHVKIISNTLFQIKEKINRASILQGQ